ncbi:CDP-6-deoxy-L-threo-D-glycero-4-hexulose-3-dehydrase reductase [alpha proteobacterium HTCC2255]|nr:CDP-6-deoxy-L-threo-D-glycero-4-hexulose-3-dehydrase reductase [alpha proteobacterium HTCC2255] [Rhodobacterales bacterium HTCC2255]
MPTISLSNGVAFECGLGETILDAARKHNIAIEHSCTSGRCGVCVAPVLSGKTFAIKPEASLTLEGQEIGNILTCCRVPVTDVSLDVEDLGEIGNIPVRILPCRISSLKLLNNDVLQVILRVPPYSNFKFVAGQYINLIEKGIRRSYSLANAERLDGNLEIQVKRVSEGLMSEYLFTKARQNDLLRIEGPLGTFSYRVDDSKNVVLMATGTGIAPIKAIIESLGGSLDEKIIYIVWGGRVLEDLYMDLGAANFKYTFVPVLSREKIEGSYFGYVQDAVLDLGLNLKETTVYACGSEVMIKDACDVLVQNGLRRTRFYSDAFVSSN